VATNFDSKIHLNTEHKEGKRSIAYYVNMVATQDNTSQNEDLKMKRYARNVRCDVGQAIQYITFWGEKFVSFLTQNMGIFCFSIVNSINLANFKKLKN